MKTPVAILAFAATVSAQEMFPFQLPWDDATESATNISWLNDKPAGAAGFITVKDGHLFTGEKRLRIFGVNVCFAGNFPTHEDAPKIAARMAKFGINCVRFHHMDMRSAPGGIFAKDGRTLDVGQLDKLDFFIAELKKNGIYANLNLHVSRVYPDRPREEKKGNPEFDKGVDNFHAPMVALQKDYARDLLTHVNKYTGKSYAEEPAVALVEINNENALGFEWWAGHLDDLPQPYAGDLAAQWSAWLGKKYGALEKAAWSEGARGAGAEMLPRGAAWSFENHGEAKATGMARDGAITFTVEKAGAEAWHAQFSAAPLSVAKGELYEARFRVRVSRDTNGPQPPKDASISVTLMQAHDPWKVLGNTSVKAGAEWREVAALVRVSDAEDNARITIGGMGQTAGTFEFTGFSLRTAAVGGALVVEGKEARIIRKAELSRYTPAAQRDWQEFIWDTETAYWNGMRDFLKKDLGVKALIVGTQGAWSPGHVQAGMDVIDSHAYWQHPDFKGRGWNADVWEVQNIPMAGAKDGGTLPGLAAQRVAGKPFICTEYNHAAPNTYGAETAPLLCAFAALQDWDGVFLFAYSHSDKWSQETFDSFFDITRHPVKMATLPGAVLSFRKGTLRPHTGETYPLSRPGSLLRALRSGPSLGKSFLERDPLHWMNHQRAWEIVKDGRIRISGDDGDEFDPEDSPLRSSRWGTAHYRKADGIFWRPELRVVSVVSVSSSMRVTADAVGGSKLDSIVLTPGPTRQNWGCYQFTVLDRDARADFSTAKRILITATGEIANTGMGWKNAEKTTVGRDWGKVPVLVEGPAAKIELPRGEPFKAWALDERGQRRAEIPVANAILEIGPQHKTLWYEVERE